MFNRNVLRLHRPWGGDDRNPYDLAYHYAPDETAMRTTALLGSSGYVDDETTRSPARVRWSAAKLRALGYDAPDTGDAGNPQLQAVVRQFQTDRQANLQIVASVMDCKPDVDGILGLCTTTVIDAASSGLDVPQPGAPVQPAPTTPGPPAPPPSPPSPFPGGGGGGLTVWISTHPMGTAAIVAAIVVGALLVRHRARVVRVVGAARGRARQVASRMRARVRRR